MRLDDDVIAVGANRARRADVDALRAAGLPGPRMRANRRLVREEFRFLELARRERKLRRNLRLRERIVTRREIALRRLVLRKPRRCRQIEHRIESVAALRVAPIEIDRTDDAARGHALAMLAAAIDVDLERAADRLLGARFYAGIATCAKVEVDRILLRPLRIERAEPAVEVRKLPRVHGEAAGAGKLVVAPDIRREHGDRQRFAQHLGPPQRGAKRTDDQDTPFRLVRDAWNGLRIWQCRGSEERRDLRRRMRRFHRPSGSLANIDEADRADVARLLGDLAKQPLLLRAGDDHVAAGGILEAREVTLAHRRMHGTRDIAARTRDRLGVERHRAVAGAEEDVLVAKCHSLPLSAREGPDGGGSASGSSRCGVSNEATRCVTSVVAGAGASAAASPWCSIRSGTSSTMPSAVTRVFGGSNT